MAVYRPIQISYWQDKFVLTLTPEQKFFYLYLMTNSKTKQCGVYELPRGIISFETGYNLETVDKLINYFTESGKILYSKTTEEIFIVNWVKYNPINNRNIFYCVVSEIKTIKNKEFVKLFLKIVAEKNNGTGHETVDKVKVLKDFTNELITYFSKGAYKGLPKKDKAPTKQQTETESKEETETQEEEESKEETETGDAVFDKFWNLYNKKVGKKENVIKKFSLLTEDQKTKIFETLPDYVRSTPDKKFRKNPETYLNNHSWNDEIIFNGAVKERRNSTQEFKPVNQI